MNDSILNTIKSMLGGMAETDTHFDVEIMIHINSVLSVLTTQLGVGEEKGFRITGSSETWSDLLPDETAFEMAKEYVYLRVRLIFDPPPNSFIVNAFKEEIKELESRLNIQGETY